MADAGRFLVVFAHPLADSLSAALKQAVVEGLESAGHTADVVDLYADGFEPVLSADERSAFVQPGYSPPADAGDYCERLKAANGIVLVFDECPLHFETSRWTSP